MGGVITEGPETQREEMAPGTRRIAQAFLSESGSELGRVVSQETQEEGTVGIRARKWLSMRHGPL